MKKYNNEKLEFLGDRVIGLVISKKLLIYIQMKKRELLIKNFQILLIKKLVKSCKSI